MKIIVTGGAGFIGSNLVRKLSSQGHQVLVIDNFQTGEKQFLAGVNAEVHKVDIVKERLELTKLFRDSNLVYHLAANADVRRGWENPRVDLEQNLVGTVNVLEACHEVGVRELIFSSTGSVYGEAEIFPTPENANFPIQTSLYGASKVSAESYIQAYCEGTGIKATIFRFVSVLGQHYTHGHIFDFVSKLLVNPSELVVLGNGFQKKSYMHVDDCVRGLINLRGSGKIEIFNLGQDYACTVRDSITWILDEMQLSPQIIYGLEDRGWIGDNPLILLDISKAQKNGWIPQIGIEEAVRATTRWILGNRWVLEMPS